jgi:hypothetical protein
MVWLRIVTLLLACCLTMTPALADSSTDVGALAGIGYGRHVGADNPVPVNGWAPGGFVELTHYAGRLRFHVDGIPTITATGTNRGPFGRSSATLSLIDAVVMVDTGRNSRFRLGTGVQVINLANDNGNTGVRNAVHVASQVYAAGSTMPLGRHRFIEATVCAAPNLRANLLLFSDAGVAQPIRPEQGAEVYYGAAYGWTHGNATYLIGFAALSYHTRDTRNGGLLDRNAGGGVTFEYRYRVGARSTREKSMARTAS